MEKPQEAVRGNVETRVDEGAWHTKAHIGRAWVSELVPWETRWACTWYLHTHAMPI